MNHHQYWNSIANQPYPTRNPKPMTTPLQAIAPILKEIGNLQPKSPTPSLVDLNKELLEALEDCGNYIFGHGNPKPDQSKIIELIDKAQRKIS